MLLHDARQLDPRLRTLWDGSLSAQPPARQVPGHGKASPEPGGTESAIRRPAQPGRGQQHPLAATGAGESAQRPAWPSAPARREPDRIAPAAQRPDTQQSPAQQPATGAVSRERRTTAPATAQDPDPDVGDRPVQRPSPDPRSPAQTGTRQAARATGTPPPAAEGSTSHSSAASGASPSADWRDDIISAAREPWQPGPSWPDHPAVHGPPEPQTQEPGIEPDA